MVPLAAALRVRRLPPIRVRVHVFLCMSAYYVEWHTLRALAPMLFDHEDKEGADSERRSVVAPAARSHSAKHTARAKRCASIWPRLSRAEYHFTRPVPSLSTRPLQQQALEHLGVLP